MTFFDDSDFAPIIPMRDGSQVTEMEEISRGEEFIQAGVRFTAVNNHKGETRE
jgi:hypothetical protein